MGVQVDVSRGSGRSSEGVDRVGAQWVVSIKREKAAPLLVKVHCKKLCVEHLLSRS